MSMLTATRRGLRSWTSIVLKHPTAIVGTQCHDAAALMFFFHPTTNPQSIQERYFSTSVPPPPSSNNSNDDKQNDDEKQPSSLWTSIRDRIVSTALTPQIQFYGMVAGGGVGAYLISRVFLSFTNFFTHLTPTVVAKWGFYTGFGTASLVGGIALVVADNLTIRADPVFRYCLRWVQRDPTIQKALGDGIQPGHLRSYRLDPGCLEQNVVSAVSNVAVQAANSQQQVNTNDSNNNQQQDDEQQKSSYINWKPPRIQMLFDVTATGPPYRTAIVTCEAIKQGGFPPRLHTTLLKVDYETGNEGVDGGTIEGDETIFLRGTPEDVVRISGRSGLSMACLASAIHINKAASGATVVTKTTTKV